MALYKIQIIETLIVIGVYALVYYFIKTIVNNSLKHTHL